MRHISKWSSIILVVLALELVLWLMMRFYSQNLVLENRYMINDSAKLTLANNELKLSLANTLKYQSLKQEFADMVLVSKDNIQK